MAAVLGRSEFAFRNLWQRISTVYLALPLERAMSLMAGYGIQLWPILQDIHQLCATCGDRAGTFLSNIAVLQAFEINDHETAWLGVRSAEAGDHRVFRRKPDQADILPPENVSVMCRKVRSNKALRFSACFTALSGSRT